MCGIVALMWTLTLEPWTLADIEIISYILISFVISTGEYNQNLDSASLAYGNRQVYYDYTGKQFAYLEQKDNKTAHTKTQTKIIIKYKEVMLNN